VDQAGFDHFVTLADPTLPFIVTQSLF